MERDDLNLKVQKRIEKNRRTQKWIRRGKIAAAAGIILAVAAILWVIVKPFVQQNDWTEGATSAAAQKEPKVIAPEAEDGSGAAGTKVPGDGMTIQYTAPGWQKDDTGWFYAADADTCYYDGWQEIDGTTYHFGSDGYIDTGWTAIGGKGYYFDSRGVYDSTRDASHMIALTFDDGPGEYTGQLLDILAANNAYATFMMMGTQLEKYGADIVPRMAAEGHTIGNHSYDHTQLIDADMSSIQWEFSATDQIIAQWNNGQGASVVRFPYGDYPDGGVAVTGHPQIYWDVDSLDWDSQNPDAIIAQIESQLEVGCIVLMHDIYEETVQACATLVPRLQSEGYELVNIETLAAANGYDLTDGVTYFSFKQKNKDESRVTDQGY